MRHYNTTISLASTERLQFIDITQKIGEIVKKSNINQGIACVYSTHTTSCIRINENEPRLIDDFKSFLEDLAPSSKSYRHDDIDKRNCPKDERINGHSHLKALLLGSSESIPIVNNKLQLGKWQSVFHVDLDGSNRQRSIMVTVIGE
jgi:secondary thiamine-phosphate synthase enzyme